MTVKTLQEVKCIIDLSSFNARAYQVVQQSNVVVMIVVQHTVQLYVSGLVEGEPLHQTEAFCSF